MQILILCIDAPGNVHLIFKVFVVAMMRSARKKYIDELNVQANFYYLPTYNQSVGMKYFNLKYLV